MKLHFVSRYDFQHKDALVDKFFGRTHGWLVLPEGGSNSLAIRGCREMMDEQMAGMDIVCCPVGTGGTLAGLIAANKARVIGFPALKADVSGDVCRLLDQAGIDSEQRAPWELVNDFHFGGYARISETLIAFIRTFYDNTDILLEPVYTGKMMFGLYEMIREGLFQPGTRICAIHTGGLQGWGGFRQRMGIDPANW